MIIWLAVLQVATFGNTLINGFFARRADTSAIGAREAAERTHSATVSSLDASLCKATCPLIPIAAAQAAKQLKDATDSHDN